MAGDENSANSCTCDKPPCGSNGFTCMGRLRKLPLIESTKSMLCELYTSVKRSHCIITTMFSNVEDGLHKGAEVVAPVTSKIGETLEGPLKAVDSAICVGLDFIEEKMPAVKLPPGQMYENTKNYVHCVLSPAIEFGSSIYGNVKDKYSGFMKEEMCKETANKGSDIEGEKSKVDK